MGVMRLLKKSASSEWGAQCYALILESILPPRQDPIRESYLEGLKTVLGYFVVAQELLDTDSISTLLSLDNFNVPDCMKRISSLVDNGTEPQTGRSSTSTQICCGLPRQ